jgi:sodium/bile acid cotransporter 7
MHQHAKETVVTYLCVSVIFFITGCTLDTNVLVQNYGRWKLHLFVQVQCFLMTSALMFSVVSATATNHHFMDPGLLVGLIFLSCVPTTISSNVVMTRQAHGNQALTVVQTTIGNLLGVFITPALVVMYTSVDVWYEKVLPASSGQFGLIYQRVLKQLGLSIYLPLALGQLVRWFFQPACKKAFIDWLVLCSPRGQHIR